VYNQSKVRNSFTASHRQTGVQPSPGKQGSIMHNGYLGRKTQSLRVFPLPPSSPSFMCWAWHHVGYPSGQLGPAVPAVSPPNFLCTPSLLAGGVGWERES